MTMSAHIYRYGQIDYDLDSGMRQNDNNLMNNISLMNGINTDEIADFRVSSQDFL